MKYERNTQVTPPFPIESVIRAEMNLQCSMARERPRSMRDLESRAIALATMDEQMAASCLSSLPNGRKGGRMRYAPAIGVAMAEIIGASYGNLRVDSMVVEETPGRVRARGFALDMEGNFGASSEVTEITGARGGTRWEEGPQSEMARVATAKARREAIFLVAPKTACKAVEAACVRMAFGNPEAHARSLASLAEWMSRLGIREERIWRALGIASERRLNVEQAGTLMGLRTAIADGDATLDEAFPPDLEPPRFIPPRDGCAAAADGEPSAAAPGAEPRLAQLVEACRVQPEAILEYMRARGMGTYRSIEATPVAAVMGVVRAWPDVMAEIAERGWENDENRMTNDDKRHESRE
jgi:hypothetical protein